MSQGVADSLQETPIGAVASDWEMGLVGDFVTALQAGVSVNAVETDSGCEEGEFGVLKSSAVLLGRFYANQHKVVVAEDVGRVSTSVVADRIIISRMNTPALVGESGYVTKDEPNLFLPDRLWQTEPSDIPHSQRWLSYWLQHPGVRRLIAVGATGTSNSMKNISKETVLSLPVPRTPLPEQQKIATILSAVDDKLDVIARQIETTQTLKQGLMQALFSRGVGTQDATGDWISHTDFRDSELGAIPKAWEVVPLGGLIHKLMDFRGRTPKKLGMDWGGGDIPALSANNVRMGYIDFDRECYLGSNELYSAWMVHGDTKQNDLLFTMEAPLGNVAVIPDDRKYILSQRVILLRPTERVSHSYLFQYLRSDAFAKILDVNATGTTAKGIQQKRLVQLPVALPSLEEQVRIADVLGVLDAKLETLSAKQAHYDTIKRGLMQKLLTGEWRVKLDSSTGTV
jgi:type I restriction enzyme S subunit